MQCAIEGMFLVPFMDALKPGDQIDNRYTIIQAIGEGGMGSVYAARHATINRMVALKLIRAESRTRPESVARFIREARSITALSNDHTVKLYDFGVTSDGYVFYTMELLSGESLGALLNREGPLSASRSLRLLLQVCESLAEAHQKGIVHRDIKPENIFITGKDGSEYVKVLDFGVAKSGDPTGSSSLTMDGVSVGTPEYLSPEQAMGNPVGPGSDVYSVGIVLHQMLTGQPPFRGENAMKTMMMHLKIQPPPVPSRTGSEPIPDSLLALLASCLEKFPEKRPSDAGALGGQFLRILREIRGTAEIAGLAIGALGEETNVSGSQTVAKAVPAPRSASTQATKIRLNSVPMACPLPVAVLGALTEGIPNYTTLSSVMRISVSPARIAIGLGKRSHSNAGIRQSREFTLNFLSEEMLQSVDYCGLYSGSVRDKSTLFTAYHRNLKKAPMILEAFLSMECAVTDVYTNYGFDIFMADVLGTYSDEKYLTKDVLDISKARPIGLSTVDSSYWSVGALLGSAWKVGRERR